MRFNYYTSSLGPFSTSTAFPHAMSNFKRQHFHLSTIFISFLSFFYQARCVLSFLPRPFLPVVVNSPSTDESCRFQQFFSVWEKIELASYLFLQQRHESLVINHSRVESPGLLRPGDEWGHNDRIRANEMRQR